MAKKKGPAWQFFNRKGKGVVCKYCSKEYLVANVNKMGKHIQKCFKCPLNVKREFQAEHMHTKPPGPELKKVHVPVPKPSPSSSEPEVTVLSQRNTDVRKQGEGGLLSFLDHMDPQLNESLNQSLAKAIYISGTPLSMVEHPLWIDFFKRLRPSYKMPSRFKVSSTYLDAQYTEMQADITKILNEARNLHLQCDGWSNIRNESIINFVITQPQPIFVECIASKERRHNAVYLADLLTNVVEKYGPEKFFVVIGDNAANMQKALGILKKKYPALVTLGCLAHLLHLLCGDILGCATVKSFMATVVDIIKTIKNSHILKAMFTRLQVEDKKKAKDRVSLKLPGNTRWGSHLFCLQSLHANKSVLQQMAVSQEAEVSAELKKRLLDDDVFWIRVEKLIAIMCPIIRLITLFEGNEPMIHLVYSKLNNLRATLSKEIPQSPLKVAEELLILKKLDKRMKRGISTIHIAADLLNPSSQGCHLTQKELIDAIDFIHSVSNTMGIQSLTLQKDIADYRDKEGIWKKAFLWESLVTQNQSNVAPLVWWRQLRGTCALADVAIRILSAPITSAATERTFNTFSWIHCSKRNRLSTERVAKISYLAHNWRLLEQGEKNKKKEMGNNSEQEVRDDVGDDDEVQDDDLDEDIDSEQSEFDDAEFDNVCVESTSDDDDE